MKKITPQEKVWNLKDLSTDSFFKFGNTISEKRQPYSTDPKERKRHMLGLLKSGTKEGFNSFDRFFLNYMDMEKRLLKLEYVNIGHENFDVLAVSNKDRIYLYSITSEKNLDYLAERDKLMNQKKWIENVDTDIQIDNVVNINIMPNLDSSITTFYVRREEDRNG